MKRLPFLAVMMLFASSVSSHDITLTDKIYYCATCCDVVDDSQRWLNAAFNWAFTDGTTGELSREMHRHAKYLRGGHVMKFQMCSLTPGAEDCIWAEVWFTADAFISLSLPIPWFDIDLGLIFFGTIRELHVRYQLPSGQVFTQSWWYTQDTLPETPPGLPYAEGHCLYEPPADCPNAVSPDETATTVVFLGDDAISGSLTTGALSTFTDSTSVGVTSVALSEDTEVTAVSLAPISSSAYTVTGCEVPLSERVAGLSPGLLSIMPQHGRVKDGSFVSSGASSAFDSSQFECLGEKLMDQHGKSLDKGEWLVVNKPLHPQNHRDPTGRMPELLLDLGLTPSTDVGAALQLDAELSDGAIVGSVPIMVWGDEGLNVLGPELVRPELMNDPVVGHLQAELQNKLRITAPGALAHPTLWVVDVGYDANGQPVSLERVEEATPYCCYGGNW